MKRPLTAKQQMFVKEYLIDLNATQAAIRAGYSAKTAEWIGPQLLGKSHVSEAVQAEMAKREKRTEITQDRVLNEIGKIAFVNLQDVYDEGGSLIEVKQLPREVAAALSSIKINLTEACALQEIKLHDKLRALEMIGKHLGMFRDGAKDEEDAPPPARVEIIVKDARKVSE
jgi:phage terminase small subunit